MIVRALEVGGLAVCCYIVAGDGHSGGAGRPRSCVAIDPGGDADAISREAERLGLSVDMILLTHAHADHIGGVADMMRRWPGAVLACSAETSRRAADPRSNLSALIGEPVAAPGAGRIIADGETFAAAGLEWRAVEIPGHDPGEMAYCVAAENAAFVGDVVFAGSVGRSDFPGGDGALLIRGVKSFLGALPPETVIYPGHGPSTTAGRELRSNPFLI